MSATTPRSPRILQDEPDSANSSTGSTTAASSFAITSTELTPSVVKSEGRALMKRLDQSMDDVEAAEELYSLCLFGTHHHQPFFQQKILLTEQNNSLNNSKA